MATTLNALTVEHLGDVATDEDLEQFKAWARELMTRDGMTESDAIAALWNSGDYFAAAANFGLTDAG